ncbi:MAG: Uma2 family endonuclease, partial [Cyanobacteria bacterium]|nr:Uma2 family endonuclease [Cyanobacteria bacterium GSL.Bin21]
MTSTTQQQLYSVEEYLEFETLATERHEYINGVIRSMAGGSPRHNTIKVNLMIALGLALKNTSYRVFDSDQRLWIPENRTFTYPDVTVVKEPIVVSDNDPTALTNPILITEVLSDSTRNYDRSEKFVTYRNISSFQEYLLIEQDCVQIEQYIKQDNYHWLLTLHNDING